jgi:hypothetical protein
LVNRIGSTASWSISAIICVSKLFGVSPGICS